MEYSRSLLRTSVEWRFSPSDEGSACNYNELSPDNLIRFYISMNYNLDLSVFFIWFVYSGRVVEWVNVHFLSYKKTLLQSLMQWNLSIFVCVLLVGIQFKGSFFNRIHMCTSPCEVIINTADVYIFRFEIMTMTFQESDLYTYWFSTGLFLFPRALTQFYFFQFRNGIREMKKKPKFGKYSYCVRQSQMNRI